MNRQQRRMNERENKKYAMTKPEIERTVRKSIDRKLDEAYQEGLEDGVSQAMVLLLTLPLEVLMDYYWQNDYTDKVPEFTNHVLEYYKKWQDGELDMDKLKADLWEYGGVRLEVSEND